MKFLFITLSIIISLLSVSSLSAKLDVEIQSNIRSETINSGEGTEFYVAFPLNDFKYQAGQNMAIYVTSRVDNQVTISNDSSGLSVTKVVKANETVEFSTVEGSFKWDYEMVDELEKTNKSFKITSIEPISVYALNSKQVTSEGYMAIPTRSWGKEYIHNSFFDFSEMREWAGGFVVLAKEDGTEVTIKVIDGANKVKGFGKTTMGNEHGDVIKITLNAGEIYKVQGDGKTRGVFDLSGSHIISSKPVGLISYHNRCMIPSTVVTSGRDHLIEMMPPIHSWGTEYASIELDRKTDKGDYFRVIAGEDNAIFEVNWFDKDSSYSIGHFGPIKLLKKGDWFEYNGTGIAFPNPLESIRGIASFKSDKPILVVQYSYSALFDKTDAAFDPFMIVLSPVEQFVTNIASTTPLNYTSNEFLDNTIHLIAIGDTLDKSNNSTLLNSIMLNDSRVSNLSIGFTNNNIPGTNLFWAEIKYKKNGFFSIKGDTPFSASLYGFASFDSFGWPISSNSRNLSITDTLSPGIVNISDGRIFKFGVTDNPLDKRNGKDGDKPKQIDLGVSDKPTLSMSSYNISKLVILDSKGQEIIWNEGQVYYDFQLELEVINKYENAMGIVSVTDNGGNTSEISIYYEVDSLVVGLLNKEVLAERVNMTSEFNLSIDNISESDITVNSISISENSNFTIVGNVSLPKTIQKGKSLPLMLTYTPDEEGVSTANVIVETDDLTWDYNLTGNAYVPNVQITNMTFAPLEIANGISAQKGIIKISNMSTLVEGGNSDITIKSIMLDQISPNADQFTNFRVQGTNKPLSEIDNLVLPIGEALTVEFDLKTDGIEGDKFARLRVISDAGPATINGELPITENKVGVQFDGNFTLENQSAQEDGGYIQAKLLEATQSSVEDELENNTLQMKLLSSNPLNGNAISLEIVNANNSNVLITLSDIKGNIVSTLFEGKAPKNSIKEFSIKGMAAGVYFINATSGDSQVITKLIIEK